MSLEPMVEVGFSLILNGSTVETQRLYVIESHCQLKLSTDLLVKLW